MSTSFLENEPPSQYIPEVLTPPQEAENSFEMAVSLPKFMKRTPQLWLCLVEAKFRTLGITDDNRIFDLCICQLDAQTAVKIEDVIVNPPAVGKWKALRSAILMSSTHSVSEVKEDDDTVIDLTLSDEGIVAWESWLRQRELTLMTYFSDEDCVDLDRMSNVTECEMPYDVDASNILRSEWLRVI